MPGDTVFSAWRFLGEAALIHLVEPSRIVESWMAVSGVQSVERAFSVLRCLAGGAAGVSAIAERVGLPKSTVSRLLSTLQDVGAVEQSGAGGDYRVGGGLVDIAAGALPGRSLIAAARPHLADPAWTLRAAAEQHYDGQWWPPQYRSAKRQLERNLERAAQMTGAV